MPLTGAVYSPFHDGTWWRRWWEANRQQFPDSGAIPIPEVEKTRHGWNYTPFPENVDTLDGLLALAGELLSKQLAPSTWGRKGPTPES